MRGGKFGAKPEAAELAAVVIEERAAVEGKDGVGVFGGGAAEQQPAGHAEVDQEIPVRSCLPPVAAERNHNEFAIAADPGDAPAGQLGGHFVGIGAAQHARAAQFGGHDAAADERLDGADDGFDLGELRHDFSLA